MTTTPKLTLQLSYSEVRDIAAAVRNKHAENEYTASKNIADAIAEDVERDDGRNWVADGIREARASQARLSYLHELLTGEQLEPAAEKAPKPTEVTQ